MQAATDREVKGILGFRRGLEGDLMRADADVGQRTGDRVGRSQFALPRVSCDDQFFACQVVHGLACREDEDVHRRALVDLVGQACRRAEVVAELHI